MNLLIVDDLPAVVDGLCYAIDWRSLGITQVFKAYNAVDARGILRTQDITVMLCDIQMPVQSGLELQEWIHDQQMKVRTIFLTSHAEFIYAQKALKIGGFDYIIQPAPYDVVYDAVARALEDVRKDMAKNQEQELGKALQQQLDTLAASCLVGFLKGRPNKKSYHKLTELGRLPGPDTPVYLVLLYLQKWDQEKQWEPGLMEWALGNMIDEIFAPFQVKPVTTFFEARTFCILMEQGQLTSEALERQLYFLGSVCEQYLQCSLSAYFDGDFAMGSLREQWVALCQRNQDNIAGNKGVFNASRLVTSDHAYRMPEIKQWASFITEGYPQALSDSANALLDDMVRTDRMNRQTLTAFYLAFLEMLYSAIGSDRLVKLLDTPVKTELYRNGMRSIEAMRKLIAMVAESIQPQEDELEPRIRVQQITKYINDHLDMEIKREDLAAHVNLSPDYMTRIFKAETGVTIKEYIIRQKMTIAQSLLHTTSLPVSFIAAKVGYSNFSHFSSTYKKEFGISPQNDRGTKE